MEANLVTAHEQHQTRLRPRPMEQQLAQSSTQELWLHFDARGRIGYCSLPLARLLDRDAALVEGAAIHEVLPDLPVAEATPGHNVAMLTMNYLRRQLHLPLVLGNGQRLPVAVKITSTRLGTGPVFIVELQTCPVALPAGG